MMGTDLTPKLDVEMRKIIQTWLEKGVAAEPPLQALLMQRKRHFLDQDPDDATDIPDEQGMVPLEQRYFRFNPQPVDRLMLPDTNIRCRQFNPGACPP